MRITCPYHMSSDRLWKTCGCPEMEYSIIIQYPKAAGRRDQEEIYCSGREATQRYCEIYNVIEQVKRRKDNPLLPMTKPKSVDENMGITKQNNGQKDGNWRRRQKQEYKNTRTQEPPGAQQEAQEGH